MKRLMSKRGQLLRFLILVEKGALSMLLLTDSTRLATFEPGETTQNIVEIPTVQELLICFGNFLKSRFWSGSTPNSQVVICGVEFHVNSNSSCVSTYFPATRPLQLFRNSKHLPIPSVSRFTFQMQTIYGSGAVLTRGTHS